MAEKYKFKELTPEEIKKLSPEEHEGYLIDKHFHDKDAKLKKEVKLFPNKANIITLTVKNITFNSEKLKKAWLEILKTNTGKDLKKRIDKATSPKIDVVENSSCQNEHFEPGPISRSDAMAGRFVRNPTRSVVNVDLSVDYFVSGTVNGRTEKFWTNPKYYSVLVHEIAHALQLMEKGKNNVTEDFAMTISNNYRNEIAELKGQIRIGHGNAKAKGPNCPFR